MTGVTPWADVPRIVAAVDPGHVNDKPLLIDNCILDRAAAFAKTLGAISERIESACS